MSVTTANLLDLLLSSLWRDLRVEGPVSISPVTGKRRGSSKKVTPLTDQEKQDLKKQHRFIPRKSEYRLTMSGRVEWGTEDEKSHIKRHLHTVSGHARTLPAGYKPDPEKVRLAEMRKIKLDPRQTFVRRHQRGTGSDPNQVEVVVHSKGLSELYMVLQGQEK